MARTSPSLPSVTTTTVVVVVVPLLLLPLLLLLGVAIPAAAFQLTLCQNEGFAKCTSSTKAAADGGSGTCTPAPWNDDISSFRIGSGCCEFFADAACRGRMLTACNEEYSALVAAADGGDRISSLRCYY